MLDIEIAKTLLRNEHLTLVIVKDEQVLYQTDSHRISGFISAIEEVGSKLVGASVADRIVGKALALLFVYAQIQGVYAVSLKPGQSMPDFPPGGIKTAGDIKKLGAIELPDLEAEELSPGPTPHILAFARRTIQRNLYRVPLP